MSQPIHQHISNYLPIHQKIRQTLHSFYSANRIPHIIFYGSPGSGKQTLVYEFLREIYHHDDQKLKSNVMFVNCAHGKGIKFIREELKFFAKTNVQFNSGVWFKTIVLLNASHLTIDAQSALRRCIELFSHNTRFFIIVENKHKLLQPILSRFCEIHVPNEKDERGNLIQLHQWQLQNTFHFESQKNEKQKFIQIHLDGFFSEKSREIERKVDDESLSSHIKMVEISCLFYNQAISSFDLMEWVKCSDKFTFLEKSNILMCYSKTKSEFRCEKLFLLYLLDFMYFSISSEVNTLSFM
jgi:hypothetical protein